MSPDKFSQTKLYKLLMPKPHIGLRTSARLAPHKANAKYLLRHKWYVLRAGLKLNVSLLRLLIHDWSKLTPIEWMAYTHYFFGKQPSSHNMHVPGRKPEPPPIEVRSEGDVSTHTPVLTAQKKAVIIPVGESMPAEETERENAAIAAEADRVAQQFDRAWLHHIHCNPHHWQHWVLSQDDGEVKCLEMPTHFAREMVADWIGAGVAQGKTGKTAVLVWYEKNKQSIKLHDRTRELVESLVKVYVHS